MPEGLDPNEWLALHSKISFSLHHISNWILPTYPVCLCDLFKSCTYEPKFHAAIGFFEHINLLYGTVSEFCNLSTCPDMVAPSNSSACFLHPYNYPQYQTLPMGLHSHPHPCFLSSAYTFQTGPGQRVYMWVDEKGKKSKLSAPQYVDYVMTYVQKTVNDETLFPTKHGHEFPSNFDQILRRIQKLLFHVVAHIYHSHFREVSHSQNLLLSLKTGSDPIGLLKKRRLNKNGFFIQT